MFCYRLTWPEALLDNLVSMASTPKGVFFLNETNLMSQVINYLFSRYKSRLQVGKYEKFGYGFIISQLSNVASGSFYMNESEFLQSLIDEIWTELEYGSDDFMSAFPRSYSVESIDREVYKVTQTQSNSGFFMATYKLLLLLKANVVSNKYFVVFFVRLRASDRFDCNSTFILRRSRCSKRPNRNLILNIFFLTQK